MFPRHARLAVADRDVFGHVDRLGIVDDGGAPVP